MGVCPNCDATLAMTAAVCTKCGALFGPHSQWKPLVQPARPIFRSRLRPVFYVYAWLGAAMVICLLIGGEAEWIAAFIGWVISQPWWQPLSLLLGREYRSYGYWPMVVSAGLNVLILGWLAFGRGSNAGPAMRVDWVSLFVRCFALVGFFGPLLAVMTTQILTLGKFGSPIAQYVGLFLLGFPEAIIHSVVIVFAVFLAARLMPSWLSSLSAIGYIGWGALMGFIVGLMRWSLAMKLVVSQPVSLYEVLILAGPLAICGAIFLGSAMKTLRSNNLLQPTGRERPAAEQGR